MNAICIIVLDKDHAIDSVKMFYVDSSMSTGLSLVAENYFSQICTDHDLLDDDDVEIALEDGYADFDDGWSVWINWPLIEKVRE